MEHSHSHILEVSWNGGTPKSSIWFSDCHGFSIITHPASSSYWGTPIYEPPHFGSFQPLALDLLGQGQLPRATNKSCSGRRSYFLDLSKVDHGPCNQTHSLIMVLLFSGDRIPKNEPYPSYIMWSEPWQHVRRALPLLGILLLEIWLHSLAQGEFNFNELSVLAIHTCWHVLSNYDTCELLVVKCALKLKPLKSRPGKHIWVVYMSVCPLYGQQLTIKLPIKSNQYPKRGSWCAFFVVDTIATTAAEWARLVDHPR